MSEDKICPMMSRDLGNANHESKVYCLREECALWVESKTDDVPFPKGKTMIIDKSHCGLIKGRQ